MNSASIRQELKEVRNLIKSYGICHGLFRGLHVTIARDSLAFAVYFPLYECIIRKYDIQRETIIVPFIGGGTCGVASWAFCYPVDHIKTYYQSRKYMYGKIALHRAIAYHVKCEGGYLSLLYGINATVWVCFLFVFVLLYF